MEAIRYSTDYGNPDSDFSLGELTPKHFSFNSHFGACPACHGLGTEMVVDQELMIADPAEVDRRWRDRALRRGTKRMQAYYRTMQKALVKHFGVDEFLPYADLPEKFKTALIHGTGEQAIPNEFWGEWEERKKRQALRRIDPADGAALRGDGERVYAQSHPRAS